MDTVICVRFDRAQACESRQSPGPVSCGKNDTCSARSESLGGNGAYARGCARNDDGWRVQNRLTQCRIRTELGSSWRMAIRTARCGNLLARGFCSSTAMTTVEADATRRDDIRDPLGVDPESGADRRPAIPAARCLWTYPPKPARY